MNRSNHKSAGRNRYRTIRSLESLEPRRLLAGDFCGDPVAPDQVIVAGGVAATDAGSTPQTAHEFGAIDGTRAVSGRLGWFDYVDMFSFTIERDADVQIDLNRMSRDADLYLLDDAGNLIGSSVAGGSRDDMIAGSLDAGDYTIAVVAQTFGSNRYRLSVSADLVQPEPVPVPQPVTPPPAPGNGATLPDVAYFGGSREWGLNSIGAPEAWAAGYTGAGVTVAVIDTGIDLDHPDLVHSIYVNPGEIAGNGIDDDQNGYVDDVNGYDFADNDANPNDTHGHGTHVAGTIAAANNGFGATGVAYDATVVPIRVLGADGSGSVLDVAAGIRYAADLGAQVINLSLGGGYSRAIESAIDYARSLGSLIVAAAGNESASAPGYPARFSATDDNVISVGAHSSSGSIAGFSNDVGSSGAVQIDAPGVGIYSTYAGGRYATLSGTSMAAPHVAGLAALTLSSNPDLTAPQLRQLLATTTTGTVTGSDSRGLADAKSAIGQASTSVAVSAASHLSSQDVAAASGRYLARDVASIDAAIMQRFENSESGNELLESVYDTLFRDNLGGEKLDRIAGFAETRDAISGAELDSPETNRNRETIQIDLALSDNLDDFV